MIIIWWPTVVSGVKSEVWFWWGFQEASLLSRCEATELWAGYCQGLDTDLWRVTPRSRLSLHFD